MRDETAKTFAAEGGGFDFLCQAVAMYDRIGPRMLSTVGMVCGAVSRGVMWTATGIMLIGTAFAYGLRTQ